MEGTTGVVNGDKTEMKKFFGDDEVPLYCLRHESVGYGKKKFWTVRANTGDHRLVTVMGNKQEAISWIEKNTEVARWLKKNEKSRCYR